MKNRLLGFSCHEETVVCMMSELFSPSGAGKGFDLIVFVGGSSSLDCRDKWEKRFGKEDKNQKDDLE